MGEEGKKGGVTATEPEESSRGWRPSSPPHGERRPEGRSSTSLSPEDLTMAGDVDVEQRKRDKEVSPTPEAQLDQLRSSKVREGKPDLLPASHDLRGVEGTGRNT